MQSKQAHAFGFMNTYIGLLGFPVVLTIGMAMLAGARFKRWFWQGAQLGLTLASHLPIGYSGRACTASGLSVPGA